MCAARGRKLSSAPATSRRRLGELLVIRGAVHLDIQLGPVEPAIIDTPLFQRLRYIRQTGLLHFVFPGAVHTRFSHSIGTMHVSRRVFSRLFDEYRPAVKGPAAPLPAQYVG